jgi:3D (Asp-Asp-Asp) domain-containing protein
MAAALLVLLACAPRARVPVTPSPPAAAPAPPVPAEMAFIATAYCQDGKTASGAHTGGGIVAADPGVLPLGTHIRVRGLKRGHDGVYRVMDTGTRVQGRHIDVFMASCSEAKRFGRQPVEVAIVK